MFINSAIILEPDKGCYMNNFIYQILDYKQKFYNPPLLAKFNDVYVEIKPEINNFDSIYEAFHDALFGNN